MVVCEARRRKSGVQWSAGAMTTVVICIDGFDPEYIDACETPSLDEIGRQGFSSVGLRHR
jgi:hypothetical protein